MPIIDKQEQFVIDYLKKEYCTDACDAYFHNEFHKLFKGKRNWKSFGASPVYKAQRLLATMYRKGILERNIIPLIEHEWGFPNWVWGYTLTKQKSTND